MAKGITKPVYFNPENPKELELLVWCEDKFSSFGGLVKDLLYREMLREKGLINIVEVKNTVAEETKVEEVNEEPEQLEEESKGRLKDYVDEKDVEEHDC